MRQEVDSQLERFKYVHDFALLNFRDEDFKKGDLAGAFKKTFEFKIGVFLGIKVPDLHYSPIFQQYFQPSGEERFVVKGAEYLVANSNDIIKKIKDIVGASPSLKKISEERGETLYLNDGQHFIGKYDSSVRFAGAETSSPGLREVYVEGTNSVYAKLVPVEASLFSGSYDGELVVGKRLPQGGFAPLDRSCRAVIIQKWSDFKESVSGSLERCLATGMPVITLKRTSSLCREILILDSERLYSGFTLSANRKHKGRVFDVSQVKVAKGKYSGLEQLEGVIRLLMKTWINVGSDPVILVGTPLVERWENTDRFFGDKDYWEPVKIKPRKDVADVKGVEITTASASLIRDQSSVGAVVDHAFPSESKTGYVAVVNAEELEWRENESRFIKGFIDYVEKCGFKYDVRDIVRFHTSVKCGFLTVLGGEPGTGKSSLFELYARYLGGEKLQVSVNPSWVEPADILGCEDFRGIFHEAKCGLARYLRSATTDTADRLHPVCLEEMNLACAEHYFSDFMQVISRSGEKEIVGYETAGVESGSPSPLKLSNKVRFVGTCNFDETTRAFSSRFYDRCSYIELSKHKLEGFPSEMPFVSVPDVAPTPYSEYEDWVMSIGEIDGTAQELFVNVDKCLRQVMLSPSPRVAVEMKRYILSRPPEPGRGDLTRAELHKKALDEAIAQRVVSRFRPDPDPAIAKEQVDLMKFLKDNELLLSHALMRSISRRIGLPLV